MGLGFGWHAAHMRAMFSQSEVFLMSLTARCASSMLPMVR